MVSKVEVSNPEWAFKQMLNTLLGLREGTTDEALNLINNVPPLEATMDSRILSLFGCITLWNPNHPLHYVALKQATYPSSYKIRWFNMVSTTAKRYGI